MKTSLRFLGDVSPWLGFLLAFALAAAAWWLYRLETRERTDKLRWLLPTLRAMAVFLIVLALTGPVLHHEKVIRELGRLFVFVDGSESMEMVDEEMPDGRKAAAMQAAGYLPRSEVFEEAEAASAHLAKARLTATRALKAGAEDADLPVAMELFEEQLGQALEALGEFNEKSAGFGQPGRGFVLTEIYDQGEGRKIFDQGRRRDGKGLPEPLASKFVKTFELPHTTGDGYVGWVRGFLHPPVDGDYRFWIASDDAGELWLSEDDTPKRVRRIANVNGYTEQREWEREGNQRSNVLKLKGGQRYYIEGLLNAGGTQDHLSVAWSRPGVDGIAVINGEFLSPVEARGASADEDKERFAGLRESLSKRTEKLAAAEGDPFKKIEELEALRDEVLQLQARLGTAVRAASLVYLDRNRELPEFVEAVEAFDSATRLERMRQLLLDEDSGILREIAEQQDIELVALSNRNVETMWWQRRAGKKSSGAFPNEFVLGEKGYLTDLSHTLGSMLEGEEEGVGAIVFTDGQHNTDGSPVETASVLGERGIPVFAIGYGSVAPPMDMALTEVTGPPTVFAKDRVRGEILLRDSMRPGVPYKVAIEHGGQVVWEKEIESNNTMARRVAYEFPVQELVDKITTESGAEVERRAVALQFTASVKPVVDKRDEAGEPIEKIATNNSKQLFVQAVAHPKKVLIIDSRPRWETRYLHSMFVRDEQWEANLLMEVFPPNQPQKSWERGDRPGAFPASREELFTYEVVFFGDVPRRLFRDDELDWLAEFVGSRAGGMVFIDGQRNFLTEYANTEFGKLLPVERGTRGGEYSQRDMPSRMELTSDGAGLEQLRFASSGAENAEIWGRLRPPAWVAPTKALPGAQVLVQAEVEGGDVVPVLVSRRYGAGSVLYIGSDELWRWRYNVGDRYHQKFWVQMTNWTAEQPFSVQGKNVSIAADKMVYDPGTKAALRVRIRDDEGKPLDDGDFMALLYRNGQLYSEVELEADPNQGGIFRARTGNLEDGNYEIAVKEKYLLKRDREFEARAEFVVRAGDNRELDNLSVNRELLETVARNSGGQYFAEEEARNLVNLLESIDKKKVISSETNLWSSYWWFSAIVGLLVMEWILRKRAGYL